jgi:hypothetical protein
MKSVLSGHYLIKWVTFALAALTCAALSSGAMGARESDDGEEDDGGKIPFTVPKAVCGPEDHPESGLQGQVPASLRATGFRGFSCNLQLVSQNKGEGASWQFASFNDRAGHKCAYHDTSSSTTGRTHLGTVALDVSDPENPVATAYLTTLSMIDPWESLKSNPRRELLAGDYGLNSTGADGFDVYAIEDCRYPQLLASTNQLGIGGANPVPLNGHEGAWAPDGLTYYVGDITNHSYHAIDVTDPTHPVLISTIQAPFWVSGYLGGSHGLSISDDGKRAYFASVYFNLTAPGGIVSQTDPAKDGFSIVDTSEVQERKPNAQMHLISGLLWKDGSAFQHTIPVRIGGKPYIISVDELGTAQGSIAAPNAWQTACQMGLLPFGIARIADISDEKNPKLVSKVILESNDPANCSKVLPDLVGEAGFTYDTHYCSVDNRDNATTLACSNFEAGIRVYDIRHPRRPKEIAYFNPPAVTSVSPGSQHANTAAVADGKHPDHCSAQIRLDARAGTLQTSCQDNGFLLLKFREDVWPFEDSSTPQGKGN